MISAIERLEGIFRNNPEKTALICEDVSFTYKDLAEKAVGIAQYFSKKGAKPGGKIAVRLPNCVEYIQCYFAGIWGNFTIIPINSGLPEKDIEYILKTTKPELVIETRDGFEDAERESRSEIQSPSDAIPAIFFTSGTTSRPKGVCHTLDNFIANAESFNALVGLDESTRMLHVMPMGYMAGFLNTVFCPIIAGGTVILAPQFDAKTALNFWDTAIEHEANSLWLTPTMAAFLARLNRSEKIPLWTKDHLRHVFIGTAPLSGAVKTVFEETFEVECFESYGMSEVMLVSANTVKYPRKERSVGRLLDGVEIQERDRNSTEGNLWVKSPFALKGYLNPETGSVESPLEQGWLNTGDTGYIDNDGDLYITGRTKDLIIHGGTNVSPRAVEETLLKHEHVRDAAVIGVPHSVWGEEVIAFILPEDNVEIDMGSIKTYCKENLNTDAVPTILNTVKDFPRSSTGKIQKHLLKDML